MKKEKSIKTLAIAVFIGIIVLATPLVIKIYKSMTFQHRGLESEIDEAISLNKITIWKPFVDKAVKTNDLDKLSALIDSCLARDNDKCLSYMINSGINPCQFNYPSIEVSTSQDSNTKTVLEKAMRKDGCW